MSSLFVNKNSALALASYQLKLTLSDMSKMAAHPSAIDAKNVSEIWKSNFGLNNNNNNISNHHHHRKLLTRNEAQISWATLTNNNNNNNEEQVPDSDNSNSNGSSGCKIVEVEKDSHEESGANEKDAGVASPSHHARRPMNAFLIFCKKHRPIVRSKFPTLENRGVTRILGEWWSLLDSKDKDPHTKLAKEYKDAFFNANPDFKWYKLPAPPLRTLPARPTKVEQACSPPASPTRQSSPAAVTASPSGDFTPGKLADESQLGMLSSLFTAAKTCNEQLNHRMPPDQEPPKPLKKRLVAADLQEQEADTKASDLLTSDESVDAVGTPNGRKSVRKGKGNRYADIMANGKLIKIKRVVGGETTANKLELHSTIRKLQERLSTKPTEQPVHELGGDACAERLRTISEVSEMSDVADYSKAIPSFDLDARIAQLPNLSYETYVQRKKEMKKRKLPKGGAKVTPKQQAKKLQRPEAKKRHFTDDDDDGGGGVCRGGGGSATSEMTPNGGRKYAAEKQTGSKKRKNKHNITHLRHDAAIPPAESDLSGLNTLAECALNWNNNNNNNLAAHRSFGEKIA